MGGIPENSDRLAGKPDRKRQWLWFAGLWCAGLLAALALGGLTRWVISL